MTQEELREREHMKDLIERDDETGFSTYLEQRRQERQQRHGLTDREEKKGEAAPLGSTASEPLHLAAIFGRFGLPHASLCFYFVW